MMSCFFVSVIAVADLYVINDVCDDACEWDYINSLMYRFHTHKRHH